MSSTHVGDTGASLVIQPGYPIKTLDASDNWTQVFLYWAEITGAEALIPAFGTASPDGAHPELKLAGAEIRPSGDPKSVFVEITYKEPESSTFPPSGTIIQESESNFIEGDIKDHPTLTDVEKTTLLNSGFNTYAIPTVTYRRIEWRAFSAFVFSESNILGNVGKVDNTPNGLTSPTAGTWLASGKSVRREGASVEITEEWTHNSSGWNDVAGTAIDPYTVVA